MESYYHTLFNELEDYTVEGLFDGARSVDDIVHLQSGKKGRVFFFDQEPIVWEKDQTLWNYLNSEPTILANSEQNSIDKEIALQHNPNVVDWYFFSHMLLAREWFGAQNNITAVTRPKFGRTIQYDFLVDCNLVLGLRQYRLRAMNELIKRNLLDRAFYSFNATQDWRLDLTSHNEFKLDIDELATNLPIENVSYDFNGKLRHGRKNPGGSLSTIIPVQNLIRTHFVLVMETVFAEKSHLTEKVFKPIAAGKPFVLMGGYKNLEYLRSYGFKTFGEVWNESYDTITDPVERMDAVIDLVDWFTKLPRQKKADVSQAATDIALWNRDRFWQGTSENIAMIEAKANLRKATLELRLK